MSAADPSVSLQAQHYNAGRQAISESNAGVSIDLPWFNSKKYRAGELEAQSDLLAAQQSSEGAQTQAIGMLRDQLQKIETLHHHIELYRDQLLLSARARGCWSFLIEAAENCCRVIFK